MTAPHKFLMTSTSTRPPAVHPARRLHQRPWLRLALLLAVPLIWLVGVYGGSLISLLLESFFRLNPFGGVVERVFSLDTWNSLFTSANNAVIVRTVGMAAAVTVASIAIAFPLAYYMALRLEERQDDIGPLGARSPLVVVSGQGLFLGKLILAADGIINWFVERLGLEGRTERVPRGTGHRRPITVHFDLRAVRRLRLHMAALHDPPHPCLAGGVPRSLLDASADLGDPA